MNYYFSEVARAFGLFTNYCTEAKCLFFLVSNDAGEGALLLIRKENARKGSESNQNTHLRRVPLADNVLKKWEGE